jgi:hypothetical protein
MPYIKKDARKKYSKVVSQLNSAIDDRTTIGDLNYIITNAVQFYIKNKGLSYSACNDAVGALECAKLELYRRVIGPMEEEKVEQNGEVYDGSLLGYSLLGKDEI